MLKGRSTEDLIAFSSVSFVRELIEMCPFWSSCVSGASGVDLKEIDEIQDFAVNSMALASSVTARVRNNTMSALAYRVSCVLFHSGVSHQDLIRLNHLGICMSPDRVLHLQHNLGENFDSKVLCYKKALEEKPLETLALLREIEGKQCPENTDDEGLHVIDVSEDKLKCYQHFSPQAFGASTQMFDAEKAKMNVNFVSCAVLKQVISHHTRFNFPFFK